MFKYTATYKDLFTGEERHKDLYFHMIATEFADLEVKMEGGFGSYVRETLSSNDGQRIYEFFRLMVSASYGRRDGDEFKKSEEWTKQFLISPEWEDMFFWLTDENGKNADKFWLGVFPERLKDKVEAMQTGPVKKKLTELSHEELVALLQEKTAADKQ